MVGISLLIRGYSLTWKQDYYLFKAETYPRSNWNKDACEAK